MVVNLQVLIVLHLFSLVCPYMYNILINHSKKFLSYSDDIHVKMCTITIQFLKHTHLPLD
jgi:hypothetical protein